MKQELLKIKEKGFCGCLKVAKIKLNQLLNRIVIPVARLLPIRQDLILIESESDCCDNAYALFRKMKTVGITNTHHLVWLVDHPENYKSEGNVEYIYKSNNSFSLKRAKYLATCKYNIFDHCNALQDFTPRKGQKSIYLTHGGPYKGPSSDVIKKNNADEVYVTGKLFFEPMRKLCNCRREALLDIGYPRLDYFFEPIGERQKLFIKDYRFDQYNKIILWMPTFRKSNNSVLSEEYFTSFTGLPILETEEQLVQFDDFLKEENILCIFKVHHLQADLPSFSYPFSNILMLNNEILSESNLQLYQIVMLTDILITDYSSISTDYMLLHKPIIYTLDDYEAYEKSRGFALQNVKQYFIGYHVETQKNLFDAIKQSINTEKDPYQEARNKILPTMHTYCDGNASERILRRLGLI